MYCIRLRLLKKNRFNLVHKQRINYVNSYLLTKKRTIRTFNDTHIEKNDQNLIKTYGSVALRELLESSGISLTQNEVRELNDILSSEDLKDIVSDNNLWLKMKLSPINKVKIKKLLSITPSPISPQRQSFLTSASLNDIPQDNSLSFPFDIPASDTKNLYALPFNLCSSKFDRIYNYLLNGKDCIMIGNDYKGKTTAMHELKDLMILKCNDIIPLYIDVSAQKSRLRYDISKAFVHALSSLCGDFDAHDSLLKLQPSDLLKKLVSDCSLFKKKVVLLIDHIEEVTWTKRMELLVDLLEMPRINGRSSSKPFSVVISGTETLYQELLLYDNKWETLCKKEVWNPVFQNSHIKALSEHLELTNGKLAPNDIKRIKELTNGHPWYVNRLLHEISIYAFNTSDPVKYAANKMINYTLMNGLRKIDFDFTNAFEFLFSKYCFASEDEYLYEVCVDKLGWFVDYETSKGTILSYTNPLVREMVVYAMCKKYYDDMNEAKKVIVRMVDYKSPESVFKGWQRFLPEISDYKNPSIVFLRYMRMISDMYALDLSHEWPIGRNILTVNVQNNVYMNDKHRFTYVGHKSYKNNKEKLIRKIIIPEAEKALNAGFNKVTFIIAGDGKKDTIEMFGVELTLLYEEAF